MKAEIARIQRIELACYTLRLYCPLCGKVAYPEDAEGLAELKPCKHTLFVAHDEGFEYRSSRFNQLMKIENVADDDLELDGKGYDDFTDKLCCPDSVKFAIYVPAPSCFGAYYGFAPVIDE